MDLTRESLEMTKSEARRQGMRQAIPIAKAIGDIKGAVHGIPSDAGGVGG
jgi:hypothetical protein